MPANPYFALTVPLRPPPHPPPAPVAGAGGTRPLPPISARPCPWPRVWPFCSAPGLVLLLPSVRPCPCSPSSRPLPLPCVHRAFPPFVCASWLLVARSVTSACPGFPGPTGPAGARRLAPRWFPPPGRRLPPLFAWRRTRARVCGCQHPCWRAPGALLSAPGVPGAFTPGCRSADRPRGVAECGIDGPDSGAVRRLYVASPQPPPSPMGPPSGIPGKKGGEAADFTQAYRQPRAIRPSLPRPLPLHIGPYR